MGTVLWPSVVLDDRVCECCSTDAVLAGDGPVVVYRDRSPEEIRDTYSVKWDEAGWSEPSSVAADGWRIEGCPVNGPEAAAEGDLVAVSWFTAAGDASAVQVVFSQDGGRSFGDPVMVDGDGPFGRVDTALDGEGGAIVGWVARSGDAAAVRLRRVDGSGTAGEPITVAETVAARASGFPRVARRGDAILVAWVDLADEEASRIRLREVPLASIPN